MSTTFVTLEYVHKLKGAGVSEKQEETHAKVLSEIIQTSQDIRQDTEKTKAELLKWNVDDVFTAIIKLFG
jgi:hypothetical protein